MKRRFVQFMALMVVAAICLCGCGKQSLTGIYTLQDVETEYPGPFSITLNEDGTFQSYETTVSSYIGMGRYTLDGDILILTEDAEGCTGEVNKYRVVNGCLVFISEGSANYRFVKLKDGDTFKAEK